MTTSAAKLMGEFAAAGSDRRTKLIRKVRRRLYEGSLHEFVKAAWHLIEPSTPFVDGWHVRTLCDHLTAVTEGRIRKLLVSQPPRTGKSSVISVLWPAFCWARFPAKRWMFASYASHLSLRDSRRRREIIQSKWYRNYWWGWRIKTDQNRADFFENSRLGFMMAISTGGAGTGEGCDVLVADDVLKADDRYSPAALRHCHEWWDTTMSTRINDPKTVARVIIGQRICENDLHGHLLEQGGWQHLCYPMRWEDGHPYATGTFPDGSQDPRSLPGATTALLWPERFDEKAIQDYQPPGMYDRAAQLQQRPAPDEGGIFSRKNFCYFDAEGSGNDEVLVLHTREGTERRVMASECTWFQTCDTALKAQQDSDWTVVGTFAVTPQPIALVVYDVCREKLPVPRQYGFLVAQRQRHSRVLFQAVEEAASGIGLIQEGVMRGTAFRILKAKGSKEQRAVPISVQYENGAVYHRMRAPYVDSWEWELTTFPSGQHDDCVDVAAYAGLIVQQHFWRQAVGGAAAAYYEEPDAEKEKTAIPAAEIPKPEWADFATDEPTGPASWGRGFGRQF